MDIFYNNDEEQEYCPSLTFKQRIIAFGVCFIIGVLLGVMSWISAFKRDWVLFGVFITLSNATALGGSFFLAGPLKQWKKMWEETRWIASLIYVIAMILTLVLAFATHIGVLVIICCVIQYLAMIWYALSYIPFARTMIKNAVKGFF